jgi:hypothetical protein
MEQICENCGINSGSPFRFYHGEVRENQSTKGSTRTITRRTEVNGSVDTILCPVCIKQERLKKILRFGLVALVSTLYLVWLLSNRQIKGSPNEAILVIIALIAFFADLISLNFLGKYIFDDTQSQGERLAIDLHKKDRLGSYWTTKDYQNLKK